MPTEIINPTALMRTVITPVGESASLVSLAQKSDSIVIAGEEDIIVANPAPYGLQIIYPPAALPDMMDDADAGWFYFGWKAYQGGWLVRRQSRATAAIADASAEKNGNYGDLAAAWAARKTLSYAA